MKRFKAFLGASIPLALGVVFLSAASQSASASCQLNSPGGQIKRIVYTHYLAKISDITNQRNSLASDIKTVLDGAAFRNRPVDEDSEDDLGHRARDLIDRVKDLAEREDRAER
jgi:hypothetical protein